MSLDGAPGDAVGDVLEARVQVEHFGGRSLSKSAVLAWEEREANLAVATALEERSHPDKTDAVVPHDCVVGVIPGELEVVMEGWLGQS